MMDLIFGSIGCGNMGYALSLAAAKALPKENLLFTDLDNEKARTAAKETGGRAVTSDEIAETADMILLAVKPQVMDATVRSILPAIKKRERKPILVTPAAGLSIARVSSMAEDTCRVIRMMPNTPVAVGSGMILYSADGDTSDADVADFCRVFAAAGRLDAIDEAKIDAASAISGCGPAFAAIFCEALADAGVLAGLPRDKAILYAAEMMKGTASLILSGEHPAVLKDKVCSPGGTTIAGVRAMEENGFRNAAIEAVTAAYERTLALGKK